MIKRARKRTKYARPWGITLSMESGEDDDSDDGDGDEGASDSDTENDLQLVPSSRNTARLGASRTMASDMTDDI